VRRGSIPRRGEGATDPPIRWVPSSFPRVKWPGRDVEYSLPSSAEVKNGWSYTSAPVYIQGAYRDDFTILYQYILALYYPSVAKNFDLASYCLEIFKPLVCRSNLLACSDF
jgi:hypothetical protein